MSLSRRPGGLTEEELGRHRARVFLGKHAVLGPTLVIPLWTVWQAYQGFAERNDFKPVAADLRSLLDEAPWAEVVERPLARGKLKTIVRGLGLRPTALLPAPKG